MKRVRNIRRATRKNTVAKLNPQLASQGRTLKPLAAVIKKICLFSGSIVVGQALLMSTAHAGPQGGVVVGGSGSISTPNANTTVITQQTNNMALDWQNFDIAAHEQVNFVQPSASSSVLNRILDQNPSIILGQLNANGRVFLMNPNGMIFGESARINVGSLVATSLDIDTNDFMNDRLTFTGEGGAIVNRGLINAATGGSVSLMGGSVSNEGIIVAEAGEVNLASGSKMTLDFDGDGLIRFQVDEGMLHNATGSDAAVNNSGSISAAGGQVLLTGKAARDVFSQVVNNEGVIEAGSIVSEGGVIRLVGVGGDVYNSGTLDVSSTAGTGGNIDVLGDRVALTGNATLDASGTTGGGQIRVGGDYQGSNADIQNASRTYVGANATLIADATDTGDGGRVIVWSDDGTQYYGDISARGGVNGGDGGFAEVSGKAYLDFTGTADLTAAAGSTGTLLLDPLNITISNASTTNGDLITDHDEFADNAGNDSVINDLDLSSLLNSADVELQATNNIIVDSSANVTWTSVKDLTLNADGDITISGIISNTTKNQALLNLYFGQDNTGGQLFIGLSLVSN